MTRRTGSDTKERLGKVEKRAEEEEEEEEMLYSRVKLSSSFKFLLSLETWVEIEICIRAEQRQDKKGCVTVHCTEYRLQPVLNAIPFLVECEGDYYHSSA